MLNAIWELRHESAVATGEWTTQQHVSHVPIQRVRSYQKQKLQETSQKLNTVFASKVSSLHI